MCLICYGSVIKWFDFEIKLQDQVNFLLPSVPSHTHHCVLSTHWLYLFGGILYFCILVLICWWKMKDQINSKPIKLRSVITSQLQTELAVHAQLRNTSVQLLHRFNFQNNRKVNLDEWHLFFPLAGKIYRPVLMYNQNSDRSPHLLILMMGCRQVYVSQPGFIW